mgnify:CR=1 FL=1
MRNVDALDALLAEWIAARRTGDVVAAFNGDGGTLTTAAPLPRRAAEPGRIDHLGGALGADDEAVYREWLGCDAGQLARWRNDGVIQRDIFLQRAAAASAGGPI